MNYTIVINQQAIMQIGLPLDLKDAVLIDALRSMFGSTKTMAITHNGKAYFWVAHSKIMDDCPLLGITTKRGIIKRMERLETLEVIERLTHEDRSYYAGGKYWDFLTKGTSKGMNKSSGYEQPFRGGMNERSGGGMNNRSGNPYTNKDPNTIDTHSAREENSDKEGGNQDSEMFSRFMDAYQNNRQEEQAYQQFRFLSILEKERVIEGAKKWVAYWKKRGMLETQYHPLAKNFISKKVYKDAPPKIEENGNTRLEKTTSKTIGLGKEDRAEKYREAARKGWDF